MHVKPKLASKERKMILTNAIGVALVQLPSLTQALVASFASMFTGEKIDDHYMLQDQLNLR